MAHIVNQQQFLSHLSRFETTTCLLKKVSNFEQIRNSASG